MLYIPYPFKRCVTCQQEYLASPRYFARNKSYRDGLSGCCKSCHSAYIRLYDQEHQESNKLYRHEYYMSHREQARVATRRYRLKYPEKKRLYDHRYRLKHIDELRAKSHLYAQQNAARINAQARLWQKTHRERARNINRSWRQRHPEQSEAHNRNRRSRKLSAEGSHTPDDILAQLKRQKKRCYYCGEKLNGKYHVDHVVPLSRGGSNGPDNLVIACPHCNCSKNDKLPHEWPEGGRLL